MTRDEYANAFAGGYPMTTRFLLSRGGNLEVAEESAQAAWAKGWEHLAKLRDPARLLAWVNTIALNLFRNSLRRRETPGPVPETPIAPRANAKTIDVRRAFAKCTPADRNLLQKHYLDGYTSMELGKQMGCSAVAVRVRVLRMRRRIRKTIEW